ncbi:ATPase AAA [Longispora fulva]|uniref:Fibronectin type-III domain-containing protein n=1 Tax=Longispora fulva TaxID=619741 RepID=A0A8J7KIX4_9ACTN|nr:Ig-like domain-containing protein [Longispora fulva]MBG6139815.1 hypothetical protein [Longispora fulva]GIG57801.1 ATPase AAA [Longispora fulva]
MGKRRLVGFASGVALAVCAAVLVVYAVFATGYPVRHVELNDGGIWVTSDRDGLFGRLNKPAGSLDAAFYPPGGARLNYQLDISQNGSAVVARDRAAGKLFPVDVTRGVTLGDQGLPVSESQQVRLAGGTLAVLDPKSGKVWASRVDPGRGISGLSGVDPSGSPLATVGDGGSDASAGLAVGLDGTVFAVSAAGRVATIRVRDGGFVEPAYSALGQKLQSVLATAVGTRLVVLDPTGGTLVVPDGPTVPVTGPDHAAVLQSSGPAASNVMVSTSRSLLAVDLSDGKVTSLSDIGAGVPAEPALLDNCVHAAWAGTRNGYVKSCGGRPASPGNLTDLRVLTRPEFRANRGALVLNDLATGEVWDLSTQRRVDDWSAVKPPPAEKPSDKTKDNPTTQLARDKPPKAVDDILGARPGRTTLLHVLDNDSDPAGNILSISSVTAPDNPAARLAIAPDGQTVAITVPAQVTEVHFKYTVDDGRDLNASAAVTVSIRGPGENRPPELRTGYRPVTWTVPAAGRLTLPVLPDWRDPDGDPVVLVSASTKAGAVATTSDGLVDFTAPLAAGPQKPGYKVSDGIATPVDGTVAVTVQSSTATAALPATALPDVARGQVGQPVTIRPLDNDVPGSDPTDPTTKLALAGELPTPAGAVVVTDLHSGTVTVTAARAGTFFLDYTAAYGNAPFAKSTVRVDIVAAPATPAPPVAMPDSAVVHSQQPSTVDVLANDFDPSGGVLVLQHAAPVAADAQVQVAIIGGRWLRVNALAPVVNPNPQLIRYTVTDGVTGPVTGEVTVTQLPAPAADTPVPQDDYAVVRAGDAVTIPVLDNDTTSGGSPITLVANVAGAPGPGQLTISPAGGTAYVTGNLVRYVAPLTVTTPLTVTVDYVAQDPAGDVAVGHAHVTVVPPPTAANPDRPPVPRPVEARAVGGATVILTVPSTGVDPDGDSVSVTGLDSAPALGRILAGNATSLTYQAYPTSSGTDTFRYRVTDRYGKSGTAMIRVGVVPPGTPQPPVAVDDVVTAAPGAHLRVDVLANDLRAPDDAMTIEPLARRNPELPHGVSLTAPDGVVELTAPDLTGRPLVLVYAVTDGIGQPSVATLTVHSQKGYDLPPLTRDTFAEPATGATTVTVDVLHQCGDPDGDPRDLTVTRVFDPQARIAGGKVTVPVADQPRTVAYEVRDQGGATAVGLVHVPVPGASGPYAKPGRTVTVPKNGAVTVDIADYVLDPASKPLRLTTTDRIWASPAFGVAVNNQGDHQLVLTGRADYTGPAALTFQVTDGASLTDPQGRTAVVTLPVQVGPETPVLRCPADALSVIEGGEPITVDVSSVCHVWVADPAKLTGTKYTASWENAAPAGVSLDGSGKHALVVTAAGSAVPDTTGTLVIGVVGADTVPARLPIRVVAAAPPSVTPITVDGVKAGDTATVNLVPYVRSQLRDPAVVAVAVSEVPGGMPATAVVSGATVKITPGAQSHGTMSFTVVVSDVADQNRADRRVTGQITLHVLGVPDPPGPPDIGRTVLSRSVQLSWSTPANNGAPIDAYEVSWSGGTRTCPASPCLITDLTNGTTYTFTVRARNLVGWGRPSAASGPAQPNTVPGAVTALAVSDPQDGTLHLAWNTPPNDGTAVLRYEVTWTGGGHQTVSGTSTTATGLVNDSQYVFTVIAVNSQGPGPAATVPGQSAGVPPQPQAPTFTSVDSANSSQRAVTVSWPADDPNGPAPTTYTLTRNGGGSKTVCAAVTATSCPDDGLTNDGTIYTYAVTAANAVGHTSAPSPGTQMEATATPEPMTGVSVSPTGADGQATLRFDAPASHGATSTVTCTYSGGSCGSWTFSPAGQSGVTRTVNGLPNGQNVALNVQNCNGSHGGTGAGNPCDSPVAVGVTTYGPMRNLAISTSANGTDVNFTVSVDPNGKPATVNVSTSRQNQTFTTGVGGWSWSSTDNMGYSATDTITVTVSDGGRPTLSQSASQATPPPPPTVAISKGRACGGGGGSACVGKGQCLSTSCAYIHVQTANFGGNVSCSFTSQDGSGGFVTNTYGANESRDSSDWFGFPTHWVTVTCGGVSSTMNWY